MATAGSKEARQLERVMHQFEKAYREVTKSGVKVEGGTKYAAEWVAFKTKVKNILKAKETCNFLIKVHVKSLNIRKGPSTSYKVVGKITDKGTYTISKTNAKGTWGYLKSGAGWICIKDKYCTKV